jgi:hypothetical protein
MKNSLMVRYRGTYGTGTCGDCGRKLGIRCAEVTRGIDGLNVMVFVLCIRCAGREQKRMLSEKREGRFTRAFRELRRKK